MRSVAVSVLTVADPSLWAELEARMPELAELTQVLSETSKVVPPALEPTLLDTLARQGAPALVRYARRDAAQVAAAREELGQVLSGLRHETVQVLREAQRHAIDDVVIGMHAYDPLHHARAVRALQSAGLLMAMSEDGPSGRFRLHPDLPPPPMHVYDFEDAVMDETEDLSEATPGSISLLGDLAAFAAALQRVRPRRTATGALTRVDARKLGRQLGVKPLAQTGLLADLPRWTRALQALEALGAVSTDPMSRELFLDLGLETTLQGTAEEAVDRFLHRVVDRDLHVIIPAVRAALAQAGPGAIDEMVFLEELRDQHRNIIFPRWSRHGIECYPGADGAELRPWDDEGWERVESRMVGAALKRLQTLGLVRRAPGVFAATEEGRRWAGVATHPAPPIWVSSDLEITIPPGSLTPWERFQVERLGHCVARDVVDRYRLERAAVVEWLSTHDIAEAIGLLEARCPALPGTVRTQLETWSTSATRVILVRGVILDEEQR